MSGNREMIAEITGDRHVTAYRRVNGRKGHNYRSGLLSWHLVQPRVKGLSYVLTANGYAILPTGLAGRRQGFDRGELIR